MALRSSSTAAAPQWRRHSKSAATQPKGGVRCVCFTLSMRSSLLGSWRVTASETSIHSLTLTLAPLTGSWRREGGREAGRLGSRSLLLFHLLPPTLPPSLLLSYIPPFNKILDGNSQHLYICANQIRILVDLVLNMHKEDNVVLKQ